MATVVGEIYITTVENGKELFLLTGIEADFYVGTLLAYNQPYERKWNPIRIGETFKYKKSLARQATTEDLKNVLLWFFPPRPLLKKIWLRKILRMPLTPTTRKALEELLAELK